MATDDINIESLLNKESENVEAKKGDILIASPLLDDLYFKRSAILILDMDANGGHIGLTLNIRTGITLQDLFPGWREASKIKIYSGGPVETDRLFMLHTLGDVFEDSKEIAPGLYVGANLDEVIEYINNENNNLEGKIRFFLGYSGWAKDQLTTEILNQHWTVNTAPQMSDSLIGTGNEYWRREVSRLGEKYRSWLLVPSDPELN